MVMTLFLSVCAFMLYLVLGLYTMHLDRRSALNRVFFAMSLNMALWAFFNALFVSAPDMASAVLYFKLGAASWCLSPGILGHFYMEMGMSNNPKQDKRIRFLLIPAYIPALLCLYQVWPGNFFYLPPVLTDYGWVSRPDTGNGWCWLYVFYLNFTIIAGTIVLGIQGFSSALKKKRIQSAIIIAGTVISAAIAQTTNFILPGAGIHALPELGVCAILVLFVGIWFAVTRFRLMQPSAALAAEEIIANITDAVFLASPEGTLVKANRAAEEITGLDERRLKGLNITALVQDGQALSGALETVRKNASPFQVINLVFHDHEGNDSPYSAYLSGLRDSLGDLTGFMLVCRPAGNTAEIRKKFGLTEREMEILLLLAQGLSAQEIADRVFISIGTVKTHIHNIYEKTRAKNRIELAHLIQ